MKLIISSLTALKNIFEVNFKFKNLSSRIIIRLKLIAKNNYYIQSPNFVDNRKMNQMKARRIDSLIRFLFFAIIVL